MYNTQLSRFVIPNIKWHYISYLMYLFHYVSIVHVDEIVSTVGLVSFSYFFGFLIYYYYNNKFEIFDTNMVWVLEIYLFIIFVLCLG